MNLPLEVLFACTWEILLRSDLRDRLVAKSSSQSVNFIVIVGMKETDTKGA